MLAITLRPNGLRFSRAAPLDREHAQYDTSFQIHPDLRAAQRRRLEALVGARSTWQELYRKHLATLRQHNALCHVFTRLDFLNELCDELSNGVGLVLLTPISVLPDAACFSPAFSDRIIAAFRHLAVLFASFWGLVRRCLGVTTDHSVIALGPLLRCLGATNRTV